MRLTVDGCVELGEIVGFASGAPRLSVNADGCAGAEPERYDRDKIAAAGRLYTIDGASNLIALSNDLDSTSGSHILQRGIRADRLLVGGGDLFLIDEDSNSYSALAPTALSDPPRRATRSAIGSSQQVDGGNVVTVVENGNAATLIEIDTDAGSVTRWSPGSDPRVEQDDRLLEPLGTLPIAGPGGAFVRTTSGDFVVNADVTAPISIDGELPNEIECGLVTDRYVYLMGDPQDGSVTAPSPISIIEISSGHVRTTSMIGVPSCSSFAIVGDRILVGTSHDIYVGDAG